MPARSASTAVWFLILKKITGAAMISDAPRRAKLLAYSAKKEILRASRDHMTAAPADCMPL